MTVTTLAYIPSPAQGVWFIGAVPIRAYALCIIIGIIAALVIGDRRWEARGGERGVIYDIALWAVPFGLVGGRVYHVLTDWPTYFGAGGAGLGAAFRIWDGGLGIWGAVALGGVGAWIGCRRRGIPLPAFGDAVAPGIILAQAIGRLGNYFNQELYGRTTTMPWGLEIYERRDAAGFRDSINGVSTGELVGVVHPTFLYELLWNLLIFALLIWVDRRYRLGHGKVFALYVAGYCLGRFWIELMRSDAATLIAGIRVNSFTSTFVFIAAVVYVMVAPKGREDPESLRGDAEVDEDSLVDEVATEAIAVGAVPGVVAAAKVAGASEGDDAASSRAGDDAGVVDAADEADDVEEPVETEVLAEESEGDSVDAEPVAVPDPEDAAVVDADAADRSSEELVVEDGSAEAEAAEAFDAESESESESDAQTDVAADVVEPVMQPLDESGEVATAVETDTAVPESEEPVVVDASSEAEAEAEAAEGDAGAADEAVAAAPIAEDGSAEADVAEAFDAESESDVAADAVQPVVEPLDESGEVATAVEAEAADEAVAAAPVAEEGSAEAAEAFDADSDVAEATEEPAEAPDATDDGISASAADTQAEPDAKSVGERFRKPRWFRRNS